MWHGVVATIIAESKGLVLCESDWVLWELSFNVKLSKPLRDVLCCPEHSEFAAQVQSDYRLPCTGEKRMFLFKNIGPLPTRLHFCAALYMQHSYTVYGTTQLFFFFLESLLSKPNNNQKISKRAFLRGYSVTGGVLLVALRFFFFNKTTTPLASLRSKQLSSRTKCVPGK